MKPIFLLPPALIAAATAAAVDIQRWKTPEGTEILLAERHELPIVDFGVVFMGAGSAAEPEGKSDTAQFTGAMLMRGTETLDEETFSARIKDLGSSVSGSSSTDSAGASFRSLSKPETLHATAALFGESLARPRLETAVLNRLQNRAVQALKQSQDYPDYIASREQTRLNYPTHPYGKSAWRTEERIRAVTLDDIRTFHRQHYAQDNAIAVIVGDINRTDAEKLVRKTLGTLPAQAQARTDTPPVHPEGGHSRRLPFKGSTQAQISIGLPVMKYDDPDYCALLVGNYILGGGGFDSRLMKELRDKHGYTYGAYSSFAAYRQAGPFNISFSTERKNSEAALAAAMNVLADFVKQGPTEEELRQAKANITGSFPLRFDSNGKLIGVLYDIGIYNRPADWLDTYNSKVNALTADDIRRAWQKRIRPEEMNVVVVGGKEE